MLKVLVGALFALGILGGAHMAFAGNPNGESRQAEHEHERDRNEAGEAAGNAAIAKAKANGVTGNTKLTEIGAKAEEAAIEDFDNANCGGACR